MEFPLAEMVAIAQEIIDSWDYSSGWGPCLEIVAAWCDLLLDFYTTPMDLDTEPPHTTLWATDGRLVMEVDLPYHLYERYKGKPNQGCWIHIPGATIKEENIFIKEITGRDKKTFIEEAKDYLRQNA